MTHSTITQVTQRIKDRSAVLRKKFEQKIELQSKQGKGRSNLSCGNLAHAVAASCQQEKQQILDLTKSNIAIISAYNDMLSAHQLYKNYPDQIKATLKPYGHTAQLAGSVPAMCDGVTQGQPGMDMSLFSRDLIAQSTAFSLSHNVFDSTILLGICDKIAPGQLMGALSYAHLPTAFIPAGPMSTGISNDEKVSVRQQYAAGEVGKEALLEMECQAYHSGGTCTFYGTANTNQLVFEAMGLMLPGSAFVTPHSPLRKKLTEYATLQLASMSQACTHYRPLVDVFSAEALVNGLVALLASGGSTNHSIHMIAIARAGGFILTWDDLSDLSDVVPLMAKMYPNGPADINEFERAGGVPALMYQLHQLALLNTNVKTAFGEFSDQLCYPALDNERLIWVPSTGSLNPSIIAETNHHFNASGGTKVLHGNLGTSVIKVSAVEAKYQVINAPAKVFNSQHDVETAYQKGLLNEDCVVVVNFNGPAANGMPELHKLMPILGNMQKAGHQVALVTDGRLSGASGKIPAAIHLSPEALRGGAIGLIQDGDLISLDCHTGELNVLADLSKRSTPTIDTEADQITWGRDIFKVMRDNVSGADKGASFLF
ncbi:phosphogluconate dehydratase [Psychromonas marina]|uniref:Phosphogluconate dehydratase n=1 Tax=Psychromonas marina TaxID=88364 RepID=A0ABQ6E2U9_9GAMM|nr:phosphogluconate dehydratase [Psychromonas marina]GLS91759.1 phosphogluconate dehydratase [Psychromonas marina]